MGTLRLGELGGEQVVIHFGGALTSVDAYTFANSLIAFADTVRAVNAVLSPGESIEIRVEALGPGSFRAVVKKLRKGLGSFFTRGFEAVFWSLIGALIYDYLCKSDNNLQIKVDHDEIIFQKGSDKIIIPRVVYDQLPVIQRNAEVRRNLRRTFQVLDEDSAIDNFGLTPHLGDAQPLLQVSRDDFPLLSGELVSDSSLPAGRRERIERARLVIIKAWLIRGNRKWAFEWNGVPISASITDDAFFQKLSSHEILIGQGDALDVELRYEQEYDDSLGVYVNDTRTFSVVRVIDPVPRLRQERIPDNN